MPVKASAEARLVKAALAQIEESGWASLSIIAIARDAKVLPGELASLCASKQDLLRLITKPNDIRLIECGNQTDENVPARDRAFDAILCWFEAMPALKPVFNIIHQENKGALGLGVDIYPAALHAAHRICDSASLISIGLQGALIARSIALLLAETIGIWVNDSDDLSKTMAHVDRRLRMAEEWMSALDRANSGRESDSTD